MTRPGLLNRRVGLFRDEGLTQGIYGEHIEDWTLVGSRWSELKDGAGTEKFADESERASQSSIVNLPYDELTKTLGPADRLRYDDSSGVVVEYDIQSASDLQGLHETIRVVALIRSPEANRIP